MYSLHLIDIVVPTQRSLFTLRSTVQFKLHVAYISKNVVIHHVICTVNLHFLCSLCVLIMPPPYEAFWNSAIHPSVCPMAQLPGLQTRWLPAA